MADWPNASPSMSALYVPTREVMMASEVDEETKEGAWECPSDYCNLTLTHVSGKPAFEGPGETWAKVPFFRRKHPGTLHAEKCDVRAGDAETMARYQPRAGNHRRDEVVLMRLGTHPDAPDRPPHEAVGVSGRAPGPDYAGQVGSVAGILQRIEAVGGEENMKREFYRHNGVDYTWEQLAYRAEQAEFQRLHDTVRELFNINPHRPWLIRGTIQRGPVESKQEGLWFITIASNVNGTVPKVRAFFEMTPEFQSASADWNPGVRVAVLLSSVRDADWAEGVNGDLNDPRDLVRL